MILSFSSVAQSCLTLRDPTDCSTPGFPVHHQLPEFTQTQVNQVGDDIQPSHSVIPFSSCLQSFPAFSPDSLLCRHLICISPPRSLHGKQIGKKWKQGQTLFSWDPKSLQMVCNDEIKTRLLLGRKAMTNLDSVLKSGDITLSTRVRIVKAMAFPVVMYRHKSSL